MGEREVKAFWKVLLRVFQIKEELGERKRAANTYLNFEETGWPEEIRIFGINALLYYSDFSNSGRQKDPLPLSMVVF